MIKSDQQKGSSGIRILFGLNACRGPIRFSEGLEAAFRGALRRAGVNTVGEPSFKEWPDGTGNFHADLTVSHVCAGTYLRDRHIAGEINMCHEDPDHPGRFRDNTALAWALAHALKEAFDPADFVGDDFQAHAWEARPPVASAESVLVVPDQTLVRRRAVRGR